MSVCGALCLRCCTYLVRNSPASQVSPPAIGTSLTLERTVRVVYHRKTKVRIVLQGKHDDKSGMRYM